MNIEILDEAYQDLDAGYLFYESQAPGLGDYFLNSLSADIDSLQIYAGIHSVHFGYYRLLSKRFPYAVFYRTTSKAIQVHAVLDCRRDPEWIQRRLQ
jgi:plasmid stabilization system protein ParE